METYFKLYVSCAGIKKRCRKSDRHTFYGGQFDSVPDREAALKLTKELLAENLRENLGTKVRANFQKFEFDGTFEKTVIFQDENKYLFNTEEVK